MPSPNVSTENQAKYSDPKAFPLIKRDLVRLLGVLCYMNKGVQDKIRQIEGIPVILNMCVVDERNPRKSEPQPQAAGADRIYCGSFTRACLIHVTESAVSQ